MSIALAIWVLAVQAPSPDLNQILDTFRRTDGHDGISIPRDVAERIGKSDDDCLAILKFARSESESRKARGKAIEFLTQVSCMGSRTSVARAIEVELREWNSIKGLADFLRDARDLLVIAQSTAISEALILIVDGRDSSSASYAALVLQSIVGLDLGTYLDDVTQSIQFRGDRESTFREVKAAWQRRKGRIWTPEKRGATLSTVAVPQKLIEDSTPKDVQPLDEVRRKRLLKLIDELSGPNGSVAFTIIKKQFNESAVPLVLSSMARNDSAIRHQSLDLLVDLGSPSAIPIAIQFLDDENLDVQREAFRYLLTFASTIAPDAIHRMVEDKRTFQHDCGILLSSAIGHGADDTATLSAAMRFLRAGTIGRKPFLAILSHLNTEPNIDISLETQDWLRSFDRNERLDGIKLVLARPDIHSLDFLASTMKHESLTVAKAASYAIHRLLPTTDSKDTSMQDPALLSMVPEFEEEDRELTKELSQRSENIAKWIALNRLQLRLDKTTLQFVVR